MDRKDKLQEIDAFTQEVEGAIDSLFNPSKKIEIDPVTNEIREVDTGGELPPDLSTDVDLQLNQSTQPDLNPTIEEIPLELEPEPEVVPHQAITDQQIWLYNIKEHIMTLEWEVTPKTIDVFAETLKEPQTDLPPNCIEIAELMAEALDVLKLAPAHLLSSILPALKLGFKALDGYITNTNAPQTQYDIETAISALKNVIKEGKDTAKIAATPPPTVEPPKAQSTADTANVVKGPATPPPTIDSQKLQTTANVVKEPEVTPKATAQAQHQQVANKKLIEAIKAHLEILKQISEKIIPLEMLIANRKGLKKLYELLHGIRLKLESESKNLSGLIGVDYTPVDIKRSLSQSEVTSFKETFSSQPRKIKAYPEAPEELFVAECATTKLAFLPEEVCCYFRTSPRMVKKAEKQGRFFLKFLKKWPWSKISKKVFGELAKLNEKELQTLDLPLKNVLSDTTSEYSNKKWGIILFKNNKGMAIFVDTKPQLVIPTKESQYKIVTIKN